MVTLSEWNYYPNNKNFKGKNIVSKRNYIEKSLIPELNNLGLNINPNSTNNTLTSATYAGDFKGKPVQIEFLTNHVGVDDDNDLFISVYYNDSGEDAGAIKSSDGTDYAVDLINSALHELGLMTDEDIADEKEANQKKADAEQQERIKAEMKKKELYRAQQDAEMNSKKDIDNIDDTAEVKGSQIKASSDFDYYLSVLKENNDMNGRIEATITSIADEDTYSISSIDMFYISANLCLLQTSNINPSIDKTVSWGKAKEYLFSVADKLNAVINIDGFDSNGKPLEMSNNASGVNVGINV